MPAAVMPIWRPQFFDNNGDPLSSGTVETYESGTSTPLATYSDSNLSVTNGTTITLNSAGFPQVSGSEVAIYLLPQAYRFVLKNSAGTTLRTVDNVYAVQAAASTNLDISDAIAGEALSANDCCYLSDGSGSRTAGRWYRTDADTLGFSLFVQVGFATAAISSGATGTIRIGGVMTGLSGLTAGATHYVSATAGAITATAPTAYVRPVGQAVSTTALVIGANPPMHATTVLLKANSGSTTNAAAENVDTVAISGLTARDTLLVVGTLASVTQATASPVIYNSTDGVSINSIVANPFAAGAQSAFTCHIAQFQSGATAVGSQGLSVDGARNGTATFTTNWTGAWTLALRHAGVTAGGTFRWSWSVYVVRGQ